MSCWFVCCLTDLQDDDDLRHDFQIAPIHCSAPDMLWAAQAAMNNRGHDPSFHRNRAQYTIPLTPSGNLMPRHPHFHRRHREFATFSTPSNQQQCPSGSTPLFPCPNYRTPERKKTNETAPTALSPREPAPSSAQASWPGPRSDSGHHRRSRGCWGWCLVSRSRKNCRGRWR